MDVKLPLCAEVNMADGSVYFVGLFSSLDDLCSRLPKELLTLGHERILFTTVYAVKKGGLMTSLGEITRDGMEFNSSWYLP